MKKELKILLSALVFYTRIPIGSKIGDLTEFNKKNIKYFTLIGWIIGIPSALVAYFLILVDPSLKFLAVLFGIITSILLTGALHEDGLADFLDGFGGGWDKKTILEIMRDSRIGTFGTIGLIGIISAKLLTISELDPLWIPIILLSGQTISRSSVIVLTQTLSYSGLTSNSKSVTIFENKLNSLEITIAILTGLLPLIINWSLGSIIILCGQIIVTLCFRAYIKVKLDGFNGDCLGACQQINEMFFYLQVLILCKLKILSCKFTLLDILGLM